MARASTSTANHLSGFEAAFLRLLALLAGIVIFLSLVYFAWKLPAWLAGTTLAVAALAWLWLSWRERQAFRLGTDGPSMLGLVFWGLALLADLIILAAYFMAATDEALISPWQALPVGIFALFAIATAYVINSLVKLPGRYALPLAILHSFAAYGAAVIIYKLGFGFDPFIHEAATNFIVENGSIEPKTPFYIGQYVLVTGLHVLTKLPVKDLQIWLVPALAALLVPTALWIRGQRLGLVSAWLLPFGYLAFTVPFNLAFLLLIVTVILLPYRTDSLGRVTLVLLAAAALAIHPLIGVPLSALTLGSLFTDWRLGTLAAFAGSVFGLAGSLAVYTFLNGGTLVWPTLTEFSSTLYTLFSPAFSALPRYPLWSALYTAYYLWPWIIIALGVWLLRHERAQGIVMGTALGTLLAAVASAATLRYRNIISHEQFEFAYRLLAILPWFFLPSLASRLNSLKPRLITIGLLAIGTTAMWHVAYPQLNPVMHFHSPGVSRTDVELVSTIEAEAAGRTYAALAPQLTSAAALRTLGFNRSLSTVEGLIYPYAIPTGGPLYQFYLRLFIQGQEPLEQIRQAAIFADSELLYVAVPLSWDPNQDIHNQLKTVANTSKLVDESVWLYSFTSASLFDLEQNP